MKTPKKKVFKLNTNANFCYEILRTLREHQISRSWSEFETPSIYTPRSKKKSDIYKLWKLYQGNQWYKRNFCIFEKTFVNFDKIIRIYKFKELNRL